MEETIRNAINSFVSDSPANRFPNSDDPYFDGALVGFANADDALFSVYKSVIGPFHLSPAELVAASVLEEPWEPATVICWVLPISAATRSSNRPETAFPSRQWAQTRHFGEQFNTLLRKHLVDWLEQRGHRAIAPQLAPVWRELPESPAGVASTWSERHAAYAAGLGTFSLNDALITPRGIAHRLGSVITDLKLPPSPQIYPDRRANCLYHREGSCAACVKRCPGAALTLEGHDKTRCRAYVYGTIPEGVAERYGVTATGCGLCQTRVPCEGSIPAGKLPYPQGDRL